MKPGEGRPGRLSKEQKQLLRSADSTKSWIFLDPNIFRTGLLDIETGGLNANFAIILCVVIRPWPRGRPKVFALDLDQDDLVKDEGRMLREVAKYLEEELDGIITYYGTNFDSQFLRTRMLWHGIDAMGKIKHLDVYYTAKRILRLHSRRLDNVNELIRHSLFPESPEKTRIDPARWMDAIYSRKKVAMDYIVDHCKKDTEILGNALQALQKFVPDRILRR